MTSILLWCCLIDLFLVLVLTFLVARVLAAIARQMATIDAFIQTVEQENINRTVAGAFDKLSGWSQSKRSTLN
jgi:hypothetical protein